MASSHKHTSISNEHYTPATMVDLCREALGGVIDLDPASCKSANEVVRATNIYTIRNSGHDKMWLCRTVFCNPPGGVNDENFRHAIRATTTRDARGRKVQIPDCRVTGACGLRKGHKHPGLDSSAKRWWFKMLSEWSRESFQAGIFVGFSLDLLQTTQSDCPPETLQRLKMNFDIDCTSPLAFPTCIPAKRIAYDHIGPRGGRRKGKHPPHPSFITFLPPSGRSDLFPGGYPHAISRFCALFSPVGRVISDGGYSVWNEK